MRRSLVAANWKMNVLPSEAFRLANSIKLLTSNLNLEIVVAPPYTHLALMSHLPGHHFSLGAQNVHPEKAGAFTSGISTEMLKDLKVEYVIIGHSERREAYPNESLLIPRKIEACLNSNLKVIYCCGESIETRKSHEEFNFVGNQLNSDFLNLEQWNSNNLIIAYEPIWAIGTGLTATPEQAEEMHLFIRRWLKNKYDQKAGENTRILYGGSVKASNASSIASMDNIDGALVGGASLIPEEFAAIARCWDKA